MTTNLIKAITKISVFSLIGLAFNILLTYTFLRLWIYPQVSDIEMIFNLSILIAFEFVMVHSGVFMSAFSRSWKALLGLIFFYGLFALAFNTAISDNQILILYGAVVLNRMLPKILNREQTDVKEKLQTSGVNKNGKKLILTEKMQKEIAISAIYAVIYFILLMIIIVASDSIPQFGLTKEFMEIADYGSVQGGTSGLFFEKPQIVMCFGVVYYLILAVMDVAYIKKSAGVSLPSAYH